MRPFWIITEAKDKRIHLVEFAEEYELDQYIKENPKLKILYDKRDT